MRSPLRFCWNAMLRSTVSSTSKLALATRSNSPFFSPVQPCSWVVRTSCSANSDFSLRGRHSSRRTRIGEQGLLGLLESRHGLLSGHTWEVVEKLVERIAGLEVVEQGLERHPGAHENGRATQDVGVAVHHG